MAFYKCDKKQNSGTGFKVDDVSNFTAVADSSDAKVTLSWTDPDDFEIEGTVQAKWAGTVIVRKAYSEPKSTGDGTIVLNSTVKNQYSVNGFEDENVYLSTTYYYRAFPYTTDGVTTAGTSVSVETAAAHIYGVEWDGTASSAWTRTDGASEFEDPNPYYSGMEGTPSSPFDDIMPWSGMQIVEDSDAGTLVSIPKFWYKLTQNGVGLKIQISDQALDGFHVSPAHMDRGDGKGERDIVYVGRYRCIPTTYRSITGQLFQGNETRATFRTHIHDVGSTIWQFDFATLITIWLLYLVEYADWDSQSKIGYGGWYGNTSDLIPNGYTDSMPYHTGTTQTARNVYYPGTQYRYIEGLWDNGSEFLDGGYNSSEGFNVILNPNDFSDNSNGTFIDMIFGYFYTTKFKLYDIENLFPLFLPEEGNNDLDDYTAYSCDWWMGFHPVPSSHAVLYRESSRSNREGPNHIGMLSTSSGSISTSNSWYGARLMKLP